MMTYTRDSLAFEAQVVFGFYRGQLGLGGGLQAQLQNAKTKRLNVECAAVTVLLNF